jgi:hypothetical protein
VGITVAVVLLVSWTIHASRPTVLGLPGVEPYALFHANVSIVGSGADVAFISQNLCYPGGCIADGPNATTMFSVSVPNESGCGPHTYSIDHVNITNQSGTHETYATWHYPWVDPHQFPLPVTLPDCPPGPVFNEVSIWPHFWIEPKNQTVQWFNLTVTVIQLSSD